MDLQQSRDEVSIYKDIVRIELAEKAGVTVSQLARALQETKSPLLTGLKYDKWLPKEEIDEIALA